jgi:MFS family permease
VAPVAIGWFLGRAGFREYRPNVADLNPGTSGEGKTWPLPRYQVGPALLVLRTLFGIAMGGEWGVGASLAMETIPPYARGFVSGLLQAGYPTGYLVASIVYTLLFPAVGWRGMFVVGVLPALLVLYVRRRVPESPSWRLRTTIESGTRQLLSRRRLAKLDQGAMAGAGPG